MRLNKTTCLAMMAVILFSFTLLPFASALAQQTKPIPVTPSLLPATTKGALFVTNAKLLSDQWEKTQLGQLMKDPVMEPFAKDLRRQFSDRLSRLKDQLGIELSDLKGVPGGGMAVAMIQPKQEEGKEKESALALLIDIHGHQKEAEALMKKVTTNLTAAGGKMSQQPVNGATITMFDMPETRDYPATKVGYFLSGNILAASDRIEVMDWILRRRLGNRAKSKDTLADIPAFQKVMARCQKERGNAAAMPMIYWFIEPLGYIEALQSAIPKSKTDSQGTTVSEVVQKQGFSEIKGVGGYVDVKVGGFEFLYNIAIYAPGEFRDAPAPYKNLKPMNMFQFPNGTDFAPPEWIPNDVATYTSFNWNILAAFDNFGPLFDQLLGEGETGVWDELLASLREDEHGPQIDLRNELVKHLGPRVVVVSDYLLPITTTSERLLFVIDAKDPQAVAKAIQKVFQDGKDPTIKKHVFQGHVIWETVDEQAHSDVPSAPEVHLPNPASEGKEEQVKRRRIILQDAEDEEEKLLPHAAVTVVHGKLVIASHYDFLVRVLDKNRPFEPLSKSIDYKMVQDAMKRLGVSDSCVRSFSRTDEAYRPTYEMIRQNKMPESEAVLGRLLNAILGPKKKGAVRKQKVDGKELPDFQVVRRYLGPGGLFGKTEPGTGWFFTGFMLPK
ncbi:MAG: hypothetical protein PVH19_05160 [Planctomycetia bacterium]